MQSSACVVLFLVFALSAGMKNPDIHSYDGPLLSTFRGVDQRYEIGSDGVYKFFFTLPQQERYEERDSEGKVSGFFAFVDRNGEEVSVKYVADVEGYQPESDHLPQNPEETEEVKRAREEFLNFYRQTAKYLEAFDDDESDEDYSLSSEEDDDDDDDSSSSEEDDDESDEDDRRRK